MRIAILLSILIGMSAIVVGTLRASAPEPNLLQNGSFEQGVKGWRVFGDVRIINGVCGAKAASLQGTLQSKTLRVKIGNLYYVSFRYRGDALRATVLMELPRTTKWTQMSYVFIPQYERAVVAFEGTGEIDCVSVSEKQSDER